jgi:16S rRNA A1518/A1519 N6-dimethyltransferase RsmA/KsgA/DIM1 with predicted DNA glycosylase/AP lyase activity
MNLLFLAIIIFVLVFGFVVAFGAPYLPTLKTQANEALDLLNLKPGQTLLELGCGDGRVVKAAAGRGLKVVGYELNPVLALIAWLNTLKYRGQVKIICGNYWNKQWPETDGIFVFLLDKYMKKLDNSIVQKRALQPKPIKLVSFTFKIPNRKPSSQQGGLLLYKYQ